MRFLIMDAPRQANLHLYIRECRKHHVTEIVRACEPTYHGGELQNAGIRLHEMAYEDGHSPSKELIDRWLQLVDETFYSRPTHGSSGGSSGSTNGSSSAKLDQTTNTTRGGDEERAIAVHCVAGLGRAPVMVAIALIEFAAMDPVEAVTLIRRQRRGAINEKQLIYLEGYKRQYKRSRAGANSVCCVIS
jgi:protein tyrosine phosphatase type 4A